MSTPFIRTSARVMAILQLCVAFSALLWSLSGPFFGEYVRNKSSALLFQAVMGNAEVAGRPQRDWERFQQLPTSRRIEIERAYANLEEHMARSYASKCKESLRALLFGISPLMQIWLILSLALPIMLLRRSTAAIPAVWLIPAVTLAFALDNRWHGQVVDDRVAVFFHSAEASAGDIEDEEGWQRYLAQRWAGAGVDDFVQHWERGEHALRTAWLEAHLKTPALGLRARRSPLVLGLLLFWNSLFATVIWRTLHRQSGYAHHTA